MILEFKEIINPKFKEEIANLKNNIKGVFKKKETISEKYIRRYAEPNFIISTISIAITGFMAAFESFNVEFSNFLFIFSFIYFLSILFSALLLSENILKEKEKVKYSLSNIVKHYQNKAKNVNAKKINKLTKSFNSKQKEIIEFINDNKLYSKNPEKIQCEILKAKINSCSLEEFKLKEKEINLFIENLEDIKSKEKIKSLISKKESLTKPLFEEKQLIEKEEEINNRLIIL
tara:strand:+ start:29165 stop:29860 length:696 start_codon:yes stop_codon:yes gene_type:complete